MSKLTQNNSILISAIVCILTFICASTLDAQTAIDSTAIVENDTIRIQKNIVYEKGEEYILGGISITGLQKFSESTVKVFTGLKIGQPLKLPGDKLTSAIKKLYQSKQLLNLQ